MADIKERLDRIEKMLLGDEVTGEKGLFYDYIVTKRIIKFLSIFSVVIFSTVISISVALLKYNIDLIKEAVRLSTLIEQHIGR